MVASRTDGGLKSILVAEITVVRQTTVDPVGMAIPAFHKAMGARQTKARLQM